MRFPILAPAVALLMSCAAAKADLDDVDCSSTSFKFSDPKYNADCQRSDDPIRVGASSGAATTDVMTVTSEDRTIFITLVSRRITATRIYMQHRPLKEGFEDLFNKDGVENWNSIGKKDGYDVAEFTKDISGQSSHCITVQRYTNAAYNGYKRRVIGMGCTVGAVDAVYQLLKEIDAPGD